MLPKKAVPRPSFTGDTCTSSGAVYGNACSASPECTSNDPSVAGTSKAEEEAVVFCWEATSGECVSTVHCDAAGVARGCRGN